MSSITGCQRICHLVLKKLKQFLLEKIEKQKKKQEINDQSFKFKLVTLLAITSFTGQYTMQNKTR